MIFSGIAAFLESWRFHASGIRLAWNDRLYFVLCVAPFLVALILYGVGFYLFMVNADSLLEAIWSVEPGGSSRAATWLRWLYEQLAALVLYILLLALMFYSFTAAANLIAAPVYDYVSSRYEKSRRPGFHVEERSGGIARILLVLREELKKAVLVLAAPLPFLLIPVVGPVLSLLVAAAFIAWEYVDYSLSRDHVRLRDRLSVVWRFKFYFLGFGLPMMIPVFNLALMPFAILGATRLYLEKIRPRLSR